MDQQTKAALKQDKFVTTTTHGLEWASENRRSVITTVSILVAVILIDSVRIWAGILRGTREAQVVEAPFVMSHLSPEEI